MTDRNADEKGTGIHPKDDPGAEIFQGDASIPRDVLLEFSMTPLDKGPSVSQFVARSLEIVAQSGLDHRLGPMGTTLEGTWDECFSVVRACFEAMKTDCERISTSIKVDYRKGREGRLESKIASVQAKVNEPIRT